MCAAGPTLERCCGFSAIRAPSPAGVTLLRIGGRGGGCLAPGCSAIHCRVEGRFLSGLSDCALHVNDMNSQLNCMPWHSTTGNLFRCCERRGDQPEAVTTADRAGSLPRSWPAPGLDVVSLCSVVLSVRHWLCSESRAGRHRAGFRFNASGPRALVAVAGICVAGSAGFFLRILPCHCETMHRGGWRVSDERHPEAPQTNLEFTASLRWQAEKGAITVLVLEWVS